MDSIEERLLHCLDANLKHRDEVIEEYGNRFDFASGYARKYDVSEMLASAVNIAEKTDKVAKEDFAGHKCLNTTFSTGYFEELYGIKSFLLDFEIPRDKWADLAKKCGMPDWYGGIYYSKSYFKEFKNRLHLDEFGMALEQEKGRYVHEAMHSSFRVYVRDYYDRALLDFNPQYSHMEIMSRAEISLAEEIFCQIIEGDKFEEIFKAISEKYLPCQFNRFLNLYTNADVAEKEQNAKLIGESLQMIRNMLDIAVLSATLLRELLPSNMLTPLFFSLGSTKEQLEAKEFYSPFGDLAWWALAIQKGRLTPETIKRQLQKKGYCAS